MRVLFLDFDGVLHPLGLRVDATRTINGKPVAAVIQVDFFCWLDRLANLLEAHPDVRLVVHSSWRDSHTPEALGAYLGLLVSRYAGATLPECAKPTSIRAWLEAHPEVRAYRVLDDAVQEFEQDESFTGLIPCDYRTGITAPEVEAAIRAWLESSRANT